MHSLADAVFCHRLHLLLVLTITGEASSHMAPITHTGNPYSILQASSAITILTARKELKEAVVLLNSEQLSSVLKIRK